MVTRLMNNDMAKEWALTKGLSSDGSPSKPQIPEEISDTDESFGRDF